MDMNTLSDDPLPSWSPPAPEADSESPPIDPTMSILKKNSQIPVTVDDLGAGLIVVSFTHPSGTLYQGVLLQLNRDRGIPCGISFPKDYCSTLPSKLTTEFDAENEQPPIEQRHTYFHTNPTNTAPKTLRRFNRATKPPARYKNGRLALRLRARPPLCSKCKAYCEEINPKIVTSPESSTSLDNAAPDAAAGVGITTRRINEVKSKFSDIISGDSSSPELADDSYTVVGPKAGVVENYWKRPVPIPRPVDDMSTFSGDTEESQDTSNLILSLNTTSNNQDLVNQPSIEIQTKKQNLRICINKLQWQKEAQSLNNQKEESSSPLDGKGDDVEQIGSRRITRRDPRSTVENSTKRSATVPVRFRDEACITKNVFDFKRRRKCEKTEAEVGVALRTVPVATTGDFNINQVSNGGDLVLQHRKSLTVTPKSEVSRTPTIKISYGSSGKGVVIIPSKPTIKCIPENSVSNEKSKAEKKALRKAKKHAKRKLSQLDTAEGPGHGHTVMSNCFDLSSSQSSCSSPPPPLLTPISELCPLTMDEDYGATALDQCPPLIHFTKEIPLTPKKRKDEKKHKKFKVKSDDKDLVSLVS